MLIQGNAKHIPLKDNTIDCVITDPPYELGFMGKKWDSSGVAFQVETWQEILRVMKPGAMLFAFGGTRTSHRLICAVEDAGFEIRDKLMWLYGSGFPKSHDISKAIDKKLGRKRKDEELTKPASEEAKAWEGQGTALKPAYEDIILAMKPLDGTFAQNALKWGVAGLSIDAGRIRATGEILRGGATNGSSANKCHEGWDRPWKNDPEHRRKAKERSNKRQAKAEKLGRWPANVILDEEAAGLLDEQSGVLKSGAILPHHKNRGASNIGTFKIRDRSGEYNIPSSQGGVSRFFYCAKASSSERNAGLRKMVSKQRDDSRKEGNPGGDNPRNRGVKKVQNYHPTVKPLALIKYLLKLGTRPSHVILDPFVGSGTTILAGRKVNRMVIGMDLSWDYLYDIAAPRNAMPLQKELAVLL